MPKTIILNDTQYDLLQSCMQFCINDNASDRARAEQCRIDTTYYDNIDRRLQELRHAIDDAR